MRILLLITMLLVLTGCNSTEIEKANVESTAILEFSLLHDSCVKLTWENVPIPSDPGEAIVQINKCIHAYANLDATKNLIEDSFYEYTLKRPPIQFKCQGMNCHPFKDPAYPNHDESKYF